MHTAPELRASPRLGVLAGTLATVRSRRPWILGGLALQFVGGAIPAVVVWRLGRAEQLAGEVTKYSIRLAWHDALHTPLGIAALLGGLALVIAGSVLVARPFVRRRRTLIVAVPLAAVVGFMVLGAFLAILALFAWLVYASEGFIVDALPDLPYRRQDRSVDDDTGPGQRD